MTHLSPAVSLQTKFKYTQKGTVHLKSFFFFFSSQSLRADGSATHYIDCMCIASTGVL